MVHGVVTESGGGLRVQSEPGRGTRFSVFLPLAQGGRAHAEASRVEDAQRPSPDAAASAVGRIARVLYVDDDEVVSLTATALLQRAGFEVQAAASGEAAVALLRTTEPAFDIVITDFNMPGLSGLAVAELVPQISPGTRVMLTSGLVTDELQQRARQMGMPDVLPKEDLLERLVRSVRATLGDLG